MNEDKLAETLARIDESRMVDDAGNRSVSADSIRRLHFRRRSRERAIAAVSIGCLAIFATVMFRIGQDRIDPGGGSRSEPIVANVIEERVPPNGPANLAPKPDFELATFVDPAMNFHLEIVRETIAENLVKLARLRRSDGHAEPGWREDLDFVLKNYPGTIAAESARIEFGKVPEPNTN